MRERTQSPRTRERRSDILANLPVPRVVRVQVEVKPLNEVHVYS
ncbi:hypothetical protein KNU49_gp050 [Streptomyces phage EGole]|uniref:Uncharacterized protein n=1 Tax=Streptomyces phage EGole TaxID=2517973 RepID=A0A482JE44_9CAUD|nr:hypothetical protein KNU49_gp010 [Streptomyces phage EGole]YP_010101638.1 hypothetical protein KNU49_gp050 [Streptomyces phage EGole]QBP30808.1 hypothetical protein SEA_EGOLE_10 [Streptomyces phage EGole]QBP31004.1 hypothetical protein SEA_EGOLE_264 [Streptomyces phage EGole]